MSAIFTLQLLEAHGRYVGYVLEGGRIRCLECGAAVSGGKDAFDWHLETAHYWQEGGEAHSAGET